MRNFVSWLVLVAVLAFFIGGTFVWSFQPSPQEIKTAQEDQAETSTDAEPHQHHIPKSSGEGLALIWERTWDDPVAFYTFVLSIFTAVLGFATIGSIWLGIRQSRLSNMEFLSTHRPKLRVRKVLVYPLSQGVPITIQYEIANVGDSDATLKWAAASVEIPKAAQHPFGPPFLKPTPTWGAGNYPGNGRVIKAGEHLLVQLETNLSYADEPRYSATTMIVRGEVYYVDGNRIERHTAFERVYRAEVSSNNIHRFGKPATPDPDYEYED